MSDLKRKITMPVGTKVRMVNCLEAENPANDHVWKTRSETWEAYGNWLVLLEGKSGGFDINRLDIVEDELSNKGA